VQSVITSLKAQRYVTFENGTLAMDRC